MGYPSALTAKTWGFQDVLFKEQELSIPQDFISFVMENILFKISYPAEFHAQTAVEAAVILHNEVKKKGDLALIKYTKEYDKIDLKIEELYLSKEIIHSYKDKIKHKVLNSFKKAINNVKNFHELANSLVGN